MALGHSQQKAKNADKLRKPAESLLHDGDSAQQVASSAPTAQSPIVISITHEVSRRDSADGGSACFSDSHEQESLSRTAGPAEGSFSLQDGETKAQPVLSKSARKRQALRNKRRLTESVATAAGQSIEDSYLSESNISETNKPDVKSKDATRKENKPNDKVKTEVVSSAKKTSKGNSTKERQATSRPNKQQALDTTNSDGLALVQQDTLSAENHSQAGAAPTTAIAYLKKQKNKQKKSNATVASGLAAGKDLAPTRIAVSDASSPDSVPYEHGQDTPEAVAHSFTTAVRPRTHKSHKSLDVRLHLNGKHRDTVSVDSPLELSPSPEKQIGDKPLKIKLPGKVGTLVFPEERSSRQNRVSRNQTQAPKTILKADHRPSSSAQADKSTVLLENKLQKMIRSHEPTQSPPSSLSEAVTPGHSVSPSFVQDLGSRDQSSAIKKPLDLNDPLGAQAIHHDAKLVTRGHSGVMQARASHVHGPPSLGPPLPQNFPEQIPHPYQVANNMAYPNPHMYYTQNYSAQAPYYSPYHTTQQGFNPYQNPQMAMHMPYYEQTLANDMVYYNPDGSQAFPPEYYYPPHLYVNQYPQQHYDY